MLEAALVLVRLGQYAGAMTLFGSSLFFLYALPRTGEFSAVGLAWPRRLLTAIALLGAVGAAAGLVVQTAVLTGNWGEGFEPANVGLIISQTGLGLASVVRIAALAAALAALVIIPAGRGLWVLVAALSSVATASLAWMGHGAAGDGVAGLAHLASDILHILAASVWVGALAAFLALLWPKASGTPDRGRTIHTALHGFSGKGSAIVAAILASGLVNSWFLVGPEGVGRLATSLWGQLLLLKLALFLAMLTLAAANRFRLTPALAAATDQPQEAGPALRRLRLSLLLETSASILVLTLVAWLGTLEPPSAAG